MIGPALTLIRNEIRRIWYFRWLVLATTALMLSIAAVAIHYLPNTYDAWGQIYVAPQTPLASAAEGVSLGGNGYGNPNVVLTTLLNDDNLEKIVKRLDPAAASQGKAALAISVAQLRGKIQRAPDPADGFIELHVIDTDPVHARDVVRMLMDQFIATNNDRSQRDLSRAGAFLEQQIASYGAMLENSQASIVAFRASHPEVARLELAAKMSGYAPSFASAPEPQPFPTDADVAPPAPLPPTATEQHLSELQAKLATLLMGYTEKHPDVVATRRQIAEAQAVRDEERIAAASAPPAMRARPARAPASPRGPRAFVAPPSLAPDVAASWVDLQKADELVRANYQQLLAKQAATQMSQAVYQGDEAGRYQIVREPVVPVIPTGPNRPLYFLLAVAASIGVGVAAGYLRAATKGILVSRQELEDALQLPVIGTVSWEPAWHTSRRKKTWRERLNPREFRLPKPRRAR